MSTRYVKSSVSLFVVLMLMVPSVAQVRDFLRQCSLLGATAGNVTIVGESAPLGTATQPGIQDPAQRG
jgi:hypothetical protein